MIYTCLEETDTKFYRDNEFSMQMKIILSQSI